MDGFGSAIGHGHGLNVGGRRREKPGDSAQSLA